MIFEAASRDTAIIVTADKNGSTTHVQLEAGAMELTEASLCNRVLRLSSLAWLRSQLAHRLEWEATGWQVQSKLPTEAQVAAYAATLDF